MSRYELAISYSPQSQYQYCACFKLKSVEMAINKRRDQPALMAVLPLTPSPSYDGIPPHHCGTRNRGLLRTYPLNHSAAKQTKRSNSASGPRSDLFTITTQQLSYSTFVPVLLIYLLSIRAWNFASRDGLQTWPTLCFFSGAWRGPSRDLDSDTVQPSISASCIILWLTSELT